MPDYTLDELAKLAGLKPRTVRFYIAQGLLPKADFAGAATRYTDSHLERLRLIKRLRAADQPVADIRRVLGAAVAESELGLDADELGPRTAMRRMGPPPLAPLSAAPLPSLSEPPRPTPTPALDYIRDVLARPRQAPTPPPTPAPAPVPAGTPTPDRSQWERVELAPDIELHVRRPLTGSQRKRIDRLITLAQQLLEEDD